MNLPFPIALALEKAIDAVLRMDPETCARLATINGCVVRVNITAPTISILMTVVDGRVFLAQPDDMNTLEKSADTTITGSLKALRSLLDGNDALYKGDVLIEGDIGIGQQLKQIAAQLDPDWQDAVSPYLGDSLTHRLDTAQSRLAGWLKRSRHSFDQNTSEYLQEEIELLAPNSEVQVFCREVDELRASADRLAARVQRLENATQTDTSEQ
ncbi:MAG: SCP2 domain-containing protein [Granulosicoccus sp.]